MEVPEEALPGDVVEEISAAVHEQWMATKRAQDVTTRLSESGEELMVPYSQLSEAAKDLDRGSVTAVLGPAYPLIAAWVRAEAVTEERQRIASEILASRSLRARTRTELTRNVYAEEFASLAAGSAVPPDRRQLVDVIAAALCAQEEALDADDDGGTWRGWSTDDVAEMLASAVQAVPRAGSAVPVATPDSGVLVEAFQGETGEWLPARWTDDDGGWWLPVDRERSPWRGGDLRWRPVATPPEPVDEVVWPNCEQTIRARMSDAPGAATPTEPEPRTQAEVDLLGDLVHRFGSHHRVTEAVRALVDRLPAPPAEQDGQR